MNKFDYLIKGNNLQASLLAYYLQLAGKKVILVSENDFGSVLQSDPFFILDNISEKTAKYLFNISANTFIPVQNIEFDLNKNSLKQVSNFFMCKTGISKSEYSNKKILELTEPLVKKSNYKYGIVKHTYKYQYHRLSLEFVLAAQEKGASVYNYSNFESVGNECFKIISQNESFEVRAEKIIYTNSNEQANIKLSVIPRYRFELRNSLDISGKDFSLQLIPNFSTVVIKTSSEISGKQILNVLNNEFGKQLVDADILEEHLISNQNESVYNINGEQIYFKEGNIEQSLFSTQKFIKENIDPEFDIFKLTEGLFYNFDFDKDSEVILDKVESGYREMEQIGLQPGAYTQLFYRYGNKFLELADIAFEYYQKPETRVNAWIIAEIIYSKQNEYCTSFEDFYYRRSNLHYSRFFDSELKKEVADLFKIF